MDPMTKLVLIVLSTTVLSVSTWMYVPYVNDTYGKNTTSQQPLPSAKSSDLSQTEEEANGPFAFVARLHPGAQSSLFWPPSWHGTVGSW